MISNLNAFLFMVYFGVRSTFVIRMTYEEVKTI